MYPTLRNSLELDKPNIPEFIKTYIFNTVVFPAKIVINELLFVVYLYYIIYIIFIQRRDCIPKIADFLRKNIIFLIIVIIFIALFNSFYWLHIYRT